MPSGSSWPGRPLGCRGRGGSGEPSRSQPRVSPTALRPAAARRPDVDPELAQSLYDSITDTWIPYDQTLAVLRALREIGIKTALISNIALDVRPALTAHGILEMFDQIVLSYEAGMVKPDPEIFTKALGLLGVTPERALMVGDTWRADAGAAQLGIRTLLLPRTPGFASSLSMVVSLVARPRNERKHPERRSTSPSE